ncbi:hypothetical protein ACRN9A_20100 [Shewanella frigidimarina]|uniref:hypothetical protein n=1 Tax=Shewanella frigidimarina TaxID=56812 RepID=UPI003D7907A4
MNQSQIFRLHPKSNSSITGNYSLLLLADVDSNNDSAKLGFNRYIYLHLDNQGYMLGISISESVSNKHAAKHGEQYLIGEDMFKTLLIYKDEISVFCELYYTEFHKIFDLSPTDYFEFSSVLWAEHANVLS